MAAAGTRHDRMNCTSALSGRCCGRRLVPPRAGAQWTGITTRIAERLLETGAVDAVLTMAPDPNDMWRPVPVIVTRAEGLQHCRGMRMGYAPLLALLEPAKAAGYRRLAVIGIPCQVYALRALEDELGLERLYVIGTPCSDNTTTERFHEFLALLSEAPDTITYLEFRADYHVELRFSDGRVRAIPFLQLPISKLPGDFFPLTCRTCVDYTNVLADITVGYMGGQGEQWLLVRNDRGAELLKLLDGEIHTEAPGSAGKRHNAVKGFMANVERAAGGLPLRSMPNWLRPIVGRLMPWIGPRGPRIRPHPRRDESHRDNPAPAPADAAAHAQHGAAPCLGPRCALWPGAQGWRDEFRQIMSQVKPFRRIDVLIAILALAAIAVSLWNLSAATQSVDRSHVTVGSTPVTVYRPAQGGPAPVVLIAHGFAGSQQLMQSFALAFARNGYIAVTFDFAGHGRNPQPMTGNITREDGATRSLLAETQAVADLCARPRRRTPGGAGSLDGLRHHRQICAGVHLTWRRPLPSRCSRRSLPPRRPRNLLVITGEWEGMLKREALRAVGLAIAPQAAEAGVTYGDPAAGSGRRAAVSPHVEHASVLFSRASLQEAVGWLDLTFGVTRTTPPVIDARGPWIALLIAGAVMLARPLSRVLPRIAQPATGANLGWRSLWLPLLLPMITTPLILRLVPTHFLPVLVGDYLAVHFGTYGLLTGLA